VEGGSVATLDPFDEWSRAAEDRFLSVEARASDALVRRLQRGLPAGRPGNEVALVLSATPADLVVPRNFDCGFRPADDDEVSWGAITLVAAVNEDAQPLGGIPRGQRGIGRFGFEPLPGLIQQLPLADGWGEHRPSVLIATRSTWTARRRRNCVPCADPWQVCAGVRRGVRVAVDETRHAQLWRCDGCGRLYEVFPEGRALPKRLTVEIARERFRGGF
jgi:hypothetical protein